jgi:uncharacterized protein (TIGR03437 family)
MIFGTHPIPCNSVVVTELDPTGKQTLFTTTLGGKGNSVAVAITTDSAGDVYITGYTSAADYPITSGALQTVNTSPFSYPPVQPFDIVIPSGDTFVTKFKPNGSIAYSTFLGGSSGAMPAAISADATGSAYIAGTASANFPLTGSQLSSLPGDFLAKLDPGGETLVFSTYFLGYISAVTVDSSGNVYLAGSTDAGFPTTPGAAQRVFGGGLADGFVAKLNASGNSLIFSTFLGGPGTDEASALAIDSQGAVWVGGSTAIGFPVVSALGGAFLLKLSADGSQIETGSSFGPYAPNGGSYVDSVAVDAFDNVYAVGSLIQSTGPFSPSGFQTTLNAQLSTPCLVGFEGTGFVIEAAPNGNWVYASYACSPQEMVVLAPGHLLISSSTGTLTPYLTAPPPMSFMPPVNAASFTTAVAPGEIVSLFGSGLGPTKGAVGEPTSGLYPSSVAGVQVAFSGVAAPLLYVQAGQINTVVPKEVGSSATIQISYQGQSAAPLNVSVQAANPGVFAIVNQDGTVNSAANPAKAGSTISVYATGAGVPNLPDGQIVPLSPLFPFDAQSDGDAVLFAGVPGNIVWEGAAPGLILGVTQINVQMPSISADFLSASVPMIVQWAGTFKSAPFAVFVGP